jgi:hypothetical protein
MTIVREFSAAGPCLTLGELIKETACFYVFSDRNGKSGRIAKRTEARYSPAHVEPCRSCRDHPETQYPNGYMD